MKIGSVAAILSLAVIAGGAALIWYGSQSSEEAASGGSTEVVGDDVPFTTLASGEQSSVSARKNYIIHSDFQLRELWKMVNASPVAPTVDFSVNDVIAVFTGEEPTAGYEIAVVKVMDSSSERRIFIRIRKPGASCTPAQMLTNSFEIAVVPKTTLPLTHEDTVETISCLR